MPEKICFFFLFFLITRERDDPGTEKKKKFRWFEFQTGSSSCCWIFYFCRAPDERTGRHNNKKKKKRRKYFFLSGSPHVGEAFVSLNWPLTCPAIDNTPFPFFFLPPWLFSVLFDSGPSPGTTHTPKDIVQSSSSFYKYIYISQEILYKIISSGAVRPIELSD